MRIILTIIHGLFFMLLLPFAPAASDRVDAARLYPSLLSWSEQQHQRRNRWSLLCKLNRAARRQERINAINLPEYQELLRRKWKPKFNNGLVIRRLMLWFAIIYGVNRFEPLLKEYMPGAQGISMRAGRAINSGFDSFWKAITPTTRPWVSQADSSGNDALSSRLAAAQANQARTCQRLIERLWLLPKEEPNLVSSRRMRVAIRNPH